MFFYVLSLLTGIAGWLVAEFFGRPFRAFFQMRTEIRQEMLRLENVPPPKPHWTYPTYTRDDLDRLMKPSSDAKVTFRGLGTRLKAFTETERGATKAVEFLGFNPADAALGLIGLSNVFDKHGEERA